MLHRFRFLLGTLAVLVTCGFTGTAVAQGSSQSAKPDVDVSHYNDWEVRCPKNQDGKKECEMTQLIKSPKTGKPIMRVVMGYPPQIDTAAMIFITPLGTRLAPGLKLSVDGDSPRRIPFQICLDQGCRADMPIDNSLLTKLKGGHAATVTLVGPRGEKITLNVSLSGFTDANSHIAP